MKNNINDAKPVSAISAADNALQDFKQSMLRTECTHPYNLCSSSHVSMKQTSDQNSRTDLNTTVIQNKRKSQYLLI